jgi:1,2-diacylglycerol 3-alpha-glucosyltransferase
MRILITSSTYAPCFNGQAIFTANLAEGLASRGYEVCVVTPSEVQKPYQIDRNGVCIAGVSSFALKSVHNHSYASVFPDCEVRKIMAHFRPDIVHLHDHYPLSYSVQKYALQQGVPVIGTNHFVPENLAPYVPFLPSRLLWWWMKLTFNRLDVATAPSCTAVEILKSQGLTTPVYPVSCGVNLDRFHFDPQVDRKKLRQRYGLDQNRLTFLFVGRVDGEKRVDVLIRAVKKLQRSDIQLAVTGSGAALPTYQAMAKELGVQDQVRFTGFVSDADLPLLLNSVDVFAMPSEAELLSIASLEAMASSLPLLAARSKALPELVTNGKNGYLFKAGDVDDAARCMELLASHPEQLKQMGAASLAQVQSHSLNNVLKRYEELYSACLAGEFSSPVRERQRLLYPPD